MSTELLKFENTQVFASHGKTIKARVTACLRKFEGQAPYFSVTCATWRRSRRGWEEDAAGCQHELVADLWPFLRPVIALHLSTDAGLPLHCVENGKYFLGCTKWEPYNRDATAKHFRISEPEADQLHNSIVGPEGELDDEGYAQFLRRRLDVWKREAEQAAQILKDAREVVA